MGKAGSPKQDSRRKDPHRYDDMLELAHYQSPDRPHMSMHDRAAQFSPFAALTGHEAAILETARLTGRRQELSESEAEALDRKLKWLLAHTPEHPYVTLLYFEADEKKEGGAYLKKSGTVRKFDPYRKEMILEDGTVIAVRDLADLTGSCFQSRMEEEDRT